MCLYFFDVNLYCYSIKKIYSYSYNIFVNTSDFVNLNYDEFGAENTKLIYSLKFLIACWIQCDGDLFTG